MNQEKIGKFIASCRKEQGFTQTVLAEKLGITDRAVSKWETGRNLPDAAIMPELCDLLNIQLSELFRGERMTMEAHQKAFDALLLEMKQREEAANRRILQLEKVLVCMTIAVSLTMILGGCYLAKDHLALGIALLTFGAAVVFAICFVGVKIEHDTGHITADVLQTKDVNGNVFHEWYNQDILEPYYPKDICSHIDEGYLKYGYPLYASQSMWYYNTKAFPDGQPIHSWWEIIEKNEDGTQKYRLFTKEIGQESAYLSLFASFINNADEMAQSYKDTYGKDLEYTYDASSFDFEVPENNAGVEYLWRFSQAKMTFISDGDELVLAVHNSTAEDPALCLASAGKIGNRDESGYDIAWCLNLEPYTALLNLECLFIAKGTNSPAGARLFIRYVTGGADGQSEGMKPFKKEGNWPIRDDVEDKKNPAELTELGARANDLSAIYDIYLDVQEMWTYWLSQNLKMK